MALRVGIVGCGLIGRKRASALDGDELVACCDIEAAAAKALAGDHGGVAVDDIDAVLEHAPEVVIVAVPHDRLAGLAVRALEGGAHVLVEKPAGIGTADVDRIAAAAQVAQRRVKVGFNHRFHPALERLLEEAASGRFGDVMFARARYGHGGRIGYDREWRMDRATSGGGELVDQGMHLLDLFHALFGPLPLASALLRTQYWDAEVEDNAVVVLGAPASRVAPWATFHVTWTEWKNLFSLEVTCRTGKLTVDGLAGSYGPQVLWIFSMSPQLGPPDAEQVAYSAEDVSWLREWRHLRAALVAGDGRALAGDLDSARYAWACVEAAYAANDYPAPGAVRR
ncbi:MAG TPA: Gfo/Idh/MocA family oxidoreductase [Solirubrobacteraceae bacterium]|jgi:predicted dehydrogenase